MDLFKSSDQLESVLTRVVQKCLQPLEEKMEKRLRRLERIYNDKADREEEEGPIEYEKTLKDIRPFEKEVHFGWLILREPSNSIVVSPFSAILGLFPIYNKVNAETRLEIRKYLLHDANQRFMEEYFFNLSRLTGNSEITGTAPNLTIGSYFSHQNRRNEKTTGDFHTSPTLKREQEFITWEASEHYYHYDSYLLGMEMVKIQMEGDDGCFLYVFISKNTRYLYNLIHFSNSVNFFWPAERAKLKNVKITLPVFSCNSTTDLKKVLEEKGIKEQAFVHQAHFQLNQSGVNVPHAPSEETSFEVIEHPDNEKPIEFVANRPFVFMLTKSNHVMYMGWYQ